MVDVLTRKLLDNPEVNDASVVSDASSFRKCRSRPTASGCWSGAYDLVRCLECCRPC